MQNEGCEVKTNYSCYDRLMIFDVRYPLLHEPFVLCFRFPLRYKSNWASETLFKNYFFFYSFYIFSFWIFIFVCIVLRWFINTVLKWFWFCLSRFICFDKTPQSVICFQAIQLIILFSFLHMHSGLFVDRPPFSWGPKPGQSNWRIYVFHVFHFFSGLFVGVCLIYQGNSVDLFFHVFHFLMDGLLDHVWFARAIP